MPTMELMASSSVPRTWLEWHFLWQHLTFWQQVCVCVFVCESLRKKSRPSACVSERSCSNGCPNPQSVVDLPQGKPLPPHTRSLNSPNKHLRRTYLVQPYKHQTRNKYTVFTQNHLSTALSLSLSLSLASSSRSRSSQIRDAKKRH